MINVCILMCVTLLPEGFSLHHVHNPVYNEEPLNKSIEADTIIVILICNT